MASVTRRSFLAGVGRTAAAMGPMAWLAERASAQVAAPPVSSEQVTAAVQRGLAYLRQSQRGTGAWSGGGHAGGVTALNVLAILNAAVPANDPAVARALAVLGKVKNEHTYTVSLKCQAYAAADLAQYRPQLEAAARWLWTSQLPTGMWGYGGRRSGRGDNSNTQFALLGLHEAGKAGVKVPTIIWQRALQHFKNTQLFDGGWTYVFSSSMRKQQRNSAAYGSMTAAGVASAFICGQRLHVGGKKLFRNGAYPDCGRYKQNEMLAGGLEWLGENFSVTENPGRGRGSWLHYYLYALERVGMISGLRNLGAHDWYREGAAFLVRSQRRDGSWGNSSYDTAFAVLFLAKGNRPVLIQKLRREGDWNRNLHDLENLTVFLDDKLGKPVTWQTVNLALSVEELRQSPILYITGHEALKFTDAEKDKLRAFVETGGTILADACCGAKPFADSFRALVKDLFPAYVLRPLPKDHPVFRSLYRIDDLTELEGVDVGCRTGVFFTPRALSCLWELQTIDPWSDKALRLGTNVAAYATGKEQLPDKLDVVELPAMAKGATQPVEVPRNAVRIARIIHDGDYRADPHAMVNVAAMLRDKAKISVVARARHLRTTDPKLYDYPVVFMTGHFTFKLSDAEVDALRKYLRRGGVLIAESCCGRAATDKSFRELFARLFPDHPPQALPADHTIYTGQQIGLALGEVRYRRILAEQLKSRGTTRPPIEAVTLDGRTAILYSTYDWSCALEGDRPYSCRGYVDEDGQKLAMNLFLYAISY